MGADHPDFFKTIIPGRTVVIEGQQQLLYFSNVYLNTYEGLTTLVYTVPAGKVLYLWKVEAWDKTGKRIHMQVYDKYLVNVLEAYDFGNIRRDFSAGAAWVFEAEDVLNVRLFNHNSASVVYQLGVFGTVVDV